MNGQMHRSGFESSTKRAHRRAVRYQGSCQAHRRTLGAVFGRSRPLPGAVILLLVLVGCAGASRNASRIDPTVTTLDTLAVADFDTLGATSSLDVSKLEALVPEITQLEGWYRDALQALWNDDLGLAERRAAAIDAELNDTPEDPSPLATIYYQSLAARLDRLQDLVLEERTLQRYLAKMDSLSVISPDGAVDSTALANLMEKPRGPKPSSPRHDLALVENPLTERWVRFFTGDGRRYMDLWLTRLPRYDDQIYSMLDEYDLPHDLIFLAMIESGLSLYAHSSANAVGPWQFISSTGKIYDLKIDWWLDERRHLEKATRAAASHLSDLYESFGSWPLAFAAYNCGSRRVERAIRRHGTRDFWRLSSLPSQTRNYVPKFMAALYIGQNPERYGFTVTEQTPYAYDLVSVEDATDLRLVAELAGATLEDVADLNPHLKRWCTPPGERYEIKVPSGTGAACAEKLTQVPAEDRITWRRHQVRRGDTLSELAKHYGTSAQAIRDANKLSAKSSLRPGTYVIVPVVSTPEPGPLAVRAIADAAKHAEKYASAANYTSYRVRRGDTLSSIARLHKVSVKQIMSWNRKRSTRIHVGERLRVQARGVSE